MCVLTIKSVTFLLIIIIYLFWKFTGLVEFQNKKKKERNAAFAVWKKKKHFSNILQRVKPRNYECRNCAEIFWRISSHPDIHAKFRWKGSSMFFLSFLLACFLSTLPIGMQKCSSVPLRYFLNCNNLQLWASCTIHHVVCEAVSDKSMLNGYRQKRGF